ncbi:MULTISPECIES: pyruvate kinase [Intestinimonas]|jgi:pyruvate kinase|uniref:Pyruvate kinase n=1 Tax=Intestinimonas massiliensis (ex Afouda et al. 2020) TaxID=1673721 RepID=A0AAW5JLS6_9FIRM|nr:MULTISPECIES: pyruvate kinase [Intestinimonas]MBS6282765.1 pyruvate kinase [Oscillospiraceae bacterium]MDU1325656.1 pyruvate kinase [Clostridiales bacterium]MCG4528195.1 pyruvate kinase [Intestinimonas massiliensis (ex Afouda et al. 2020)]MCQ4771036.1 pyruvate kinase [Intestinimonas massiliensis (ex Afouda et al. 2020)]MCQ4805429.1 pyruvate kinase [Intestinimonas massiliensis (ex Afouda et al. 2020)]
MRKTKVVCTLGPAADSEEIIRQLICSGMNAARFNFSHGTHESHLAQLTKLKRVRDEMGVPVATILDTKGPEIRIKTFEKGPITLERGQDFTLTTDDVPGDGRRVSVTYQNLHEELKPGHRVLVDDGLIELSVREIRGHDILCSVDNGGPLSSNKSINIPDVHILLPSLTEKDREDLKFGAENDFDFVAASFVRKASDIRDIRECLHQYGGDDIRIIAKIENREGVDNLLDIIEVADGVMVARGDLGVEIPAHEVPILQKKMIKATIREGKPVITATQMLDSMIRNPRPTRAEVSDVANAVFDGTSCVMLSGETASGKYPVEALQTMVDTVTAAEGAIDYWGRFRERKTVPESTINDAITHTCCLTAMDLEANAILTATNSGHTARMISRYRPPCPIVAMCQTEKVRRQLAISWGVKPCLSGTVDSTDRLFSLCVECARKEGMVKPGDTVVITAGVPIGKSGSTNLIKAQIVQETL